jgi:hypothetical protein
MYNYWIEKKKMSSLGLNCTFQDFENHYYSSNTLTTDLFEMIEKYDVFEELEEMKSYFSEMNVSEGFIFYSEVVRENYESYYAWLDSL